MDVQLVMFKEDGSRRDFDLKRSVSIIGRAGDCDFQIPLAVVSRRHCQISRKENRVVVKDLGSSNGTYLNNKRVLQAEVHAGDTLTVGPVVFTILIDGMPEEVKPVPTILKETAEAPAASVADAEVPLAADGALSLAGDSNVPLAGESEVPLAADSNIPLAGAGKGSSTEDGEVSLVGDQDKLALSDSLAGAVGAEPSLDGSSLDLAGLDNIELADDNGELDLDDSALPGPLAELEALAKQRKK